MSAACVTVTESTMGAATSTVPAGSSVDGSAAVKTAASWTAGESLCSGAARTAASGAEGESLCSGAVRAAASGAALH